MLPFCLQVKLNPWNDTEKRELFVPRFCKLFQQLRNLLSTMKKTTGWWRYNETPHWCSQWDDVVSKHFYADDTQLRVWLIRDDPGKSWSSWQQSVEVVLCLWGPCSYLCIHFLFLHPFPTRRQWQHANSTQSQKLRPGNWTELAPFLALPCSWALTSMPLFTSDWEKKELNMHSNSNQGGQAFENPFSITFHNLAGTCTDSL